MDNRVDSHANRLVSSGPGRFEEMETSHLRGEILEMARSVGAGCGSWERRWHDVVMLEPGGWDGLADRFLSSRNMCTVSGRAVSF
jgi:hypothetical protein